MSDYTSAGISLAAAIICAVGIYTGQVDYWTAVQGWGFVTILAVIFA